MTHARPTSRPAAPSDRPIAIRVIRLLPVVAVIDSLGLILIILRLSLIG